MKIGTSPIGNYAPQAVRNTVQPAETNPSQSKSSGEIGNSEKEFFVNLYPGSRQEIMDYHFYHRSGKMSGVSIGSIFDKRG